MSQQSKEVRLRKGRTNMQILMAIVIGAAAFLSFYELLDWHDTPLLMIQIGTTLAVGILAYLTYLGKKTRWGLFSLLLSSGLYAFYLAGTRMTDFVDGGSGGSSYITAGAGLTFLFSAIYLFYDTDLDFYLKDKRAQQS